MTALDRYISEQVEKIVPTFEKLEFRGNIGDNSYSVEFFVTVDGKKMQCFDMVDDGLIKEKDLDTVYQTHNCNRQHRVHQSHIHVHIPKEYHFFE